MSKIVKCEKCYNCAGSPLYCVTFPLELSPCTDVLCFVVAMWACKSLEPLFATDTYVPALHTVHSASHWSRPWLKHRYFFSISSVKLHFRFGMFAARQCCVRPCARLRGFAQKWVREWSEEMACSCVLQPNNYEYTQGSGELRLSAFVSKGTTKTWMVITMVSDARRLN